MNGDGGSPTRICLAGSPPELEAAAARDDVDLPHPAIAVMLARGAPPFDAVRAVADRHDLAFVVADDVDEASRVAADGVEIDWSRESYLAARERLGAERIVGCRAGLSRHLAMEAAEAGADYVALAAPGGTDRDFAALIDMVAWWSEIIEVPCLAHGTRSADDVASLAAAGADFIAVEAAFARFGPRDMLAALHE